LKTPRRLFLRLAGAGATLPAVSRLAWAQAYPIHAVFVVFSLPVDSLARIRAELSDGNIEVTAQVPTGKDLAVGRLSVIDNQVDPARRISTTRMKLSRPDNLSISASSDTGQSERSSTSGLSAK
jgi:hypothetical protein